MSWYAIDRKPLLGDDASSHGSGLLHWGNWPISSGELVWARQSSFVYGQMTQESSGFGSAHLGWMPNAVENDVAFAQRVRCSCNSTTKTDISS